jgi:hypothetical protein
VQNIFFITVDFVIQELKICKSVELFWGDNFSRLRELRYLISQNPNPRNDIERKCNVAIPTLSDKMSNPGYGQSILREATFTVKDCRIFQSFAVMGEQLLPAKWPQGKVYTLGQYDLS